MYHRSQQSILQTETTGATDEYKKHLEQIPSSERESSRAERAAGFKTALKAAGRRLCSGG